MWLENFFNCLSVWIWIFRHCIFLNLRHTSVLLRSQYKRTEENVWMRRKHINLRHFDLFIVSNHHGGYTLNCARILAYNHRAFEHAKLRSHFRLLSFVLLYTRDSNWIFVFMSNFSAYILINNLFWLDSFFCGLWNSVILICVYVGCQVGSMATGDLSIYPWGLSLWRT